jgi:hypothetical protein
VNRAIGVTSYMNSSQNFVTHVVSLAMWSAMIKCGGKMNNSLVTGCGRHR